MLLILTDGVVSDYERTVERIITASSTVALSIIIIGIGDRDFKRMEALDSDNEPLTSADKTRQAIRGKFLILACFCCSLCDTSCV